MAKIKLDKIIFTDKKADFYINPKTRKVYARPHTVFKSEEGTGNTGFAGIFVGILVIPIMGIFSTYFHDLSLTLIVLMVLSSLCLGLLMSYFVERYTLNKQTLNKNFIEIKDSMNLKRAYKTVRKSSRGWAILMYLGFIGAVSFGYISMVSQNLKTQSVFLFSSIGSVLLVGATIYRTFRLKKSFYAFKKIEGINDDW